VQRKEAAVSPAAAKAAAAKAVAAKAVAAKPAPEKKAEKEKKRKTYELPGTDDPPEEVRLPCRMPTVPPVDSL